MDHRSAAVAHRIAGDFSASDADGSIIRETGHLHRRTGTVEEAAVDHIQREVRYVVLVVRYADAGTQVAASLKGTTSDVNVKQRLRNAVVNAAMQATGIATESGAADVDLHAPPFGAAFRSGIDRSVGSVKEGAILDGQHHIRVNRGAA